MEKKIITPALSATPADAEAVKKEAERKAKMDWDLNCWVIGMKPEDFGKTVLLQGSFYTICGIRPKAKVKTVVIRHTINGKEYVVGHEAVKQVLSQP